MRIIFVPRFLALFVLLFVQVPLGAQSSGLSPAQIAEFDAFVASQMAADNIPGLAIGFMRDGQMWTKAYGYADIESRSPMRPESMFRMASVNKPMTAAAVLQLAERGKIDLDAEVQTYVPYFPKKKFPVTVRQLLGHLGGISHYKNYLEEGRIKEHKNTREAIAIFENFDLVNEPGTRYSYSSYGYNLLGAVIEGASGMSYREYMTENIWKPLGMTSTVMDDPRAIIPNRVRGYEFAEGRVRNSEFVDISSRFAAGGIRSSVPEMLRFGDGFDDGKVLSPQSVELMYNSMATKNGALVHYSAGWNTYPRNGMFAVAHSGGQQETSTFLFSFPSRNLSLAVAANRQGTKTQIHVMKLFELITGEGTGTAVYVANDDALVPMMAAMQATFEFGRGHFERTGKAFTDDPGRVAAAFAAFNRLFNAEMLVPAKRAELMKEVNETRYAAGGPMLVMGSYMAAKLNEKYGPERLRSYSTAGAIAFFNDYIALENLPEMMKFDSAAAGHIANWQKSWERTNTAEARAANFLTADEVAARAPALASQFQGADVYPDLGNAIVNSIEDLVRTGKVRQAVALGDVGVSLYPRSDRTHAYQGLLAMMAGESEKGRAALKRAVMINPNGVAGPGSLNNFAYRMEALGQRPAGIRVLTAAVELHPKAANLYDSLGEFYLKEKQTEKAREYYQRAVDTDPNYPNAAKAREVLAQLNAGN